MRQSPIAAVTAVFATLGPPPLPLSPPVCDRDFLTRAEGPQPKQHVDYYSKFIMEHGALDNPQARRTISIHS